MPEHFDILAELLERFAVQAIEDAFAVFQPTARKLGVMPPADNFVGQQQAFPLLVEQQDINPDVETGDVHRDRGISRKEGCR